MAKPNKAAPQYLWETDSFEVQVDEGEDLLFRARHAAETGEEFSVALDLSADPG